VLLAFLLLLLDKLELLVLQRGREQTKQHRLLFFFLAGLVVLAQQQILGGQ
jgi:hypothetical protein